MQPPSWHPRGLPLVRYLTHETSQIVSRFPHDLGAHCGLPAQICSRIAASHIARMNIVRYMMFLVLGMLLGLVLSGLLSSLVAWFWG
jgi:hypothetical protein